MRCLRCSLEASSCGHVDPEVEAGVSPAGVQRLPNSHGRGAPAVPTGLQAPTRSSPRDGGGGMWTGHPTCGGPYTSPSGRHMDYTYGVSWAEAIFWKPGGVPSPGHIARAGSAQPTSRRSTKLAIRASPFGAQRRSAPSAHQCQGGGSRRLFAPGPAHADRGV